MEILKGRKDELSTENLADIALVLSDCGGIVSAQVPLLIEALAERISKSDIKDEFLRLPLEECDNFLKNMANMHMHSFWKIMVIEVSQNLISLKNAGRRTHVT